MKTWKGSLFLSAVLIISLLSMSVVSAFWYDSTVPIYEFETSGAQGRDFYNLLNATLGSVTNTTGIVGSSAVNCAVAAAGCGFNVTNSGYTNPTATQTIGFWYNGNPAALGYHFRKSTSSNIQFYALQHTNGSVEFAWNVSGTATSSMTSTDIGTGTDRCVVLTYNGTHQYAVIDNTTDAASIRAKSGAISVNTDPTTFYSDKGSNPLRGVMDEVFFANRSLTTAEIQEYCGKLPAGIVPDTTTPLSIGVTNQVNGSVLSGFCVNITNTTYNNYACNTTGTTVTIRQSNISQSNSSLYLNLTNATYFNGSALDSSPNAILATLNGKTLFTGTLTNQPTLNSTGKYGNGYTFDSLDDRIDIMSSFNVTNPFTMCGWFLPSPNSTLSPYGLVQGPNISASSNGFRWWFDAGNNRSSSGVYTSGGTSSATISTASNSVIWNTWNYICVGYNGTNRTIAANATVSIGANYNIVPTLYNLSIGRTQGSVLTFNGTIDEVRIWNASLSAAEILAEMNSAFPVRGQNLVASYSFELNNITAGASLNTTADTNYLINGSFSGEGAYYYDGVNDYVNASPLSMITNASDYTVALDVYLASSSGTQTIIANSNNGNDRFAMTFASGSIRVSHYNGSSFVGTKSGAADIGAWHRVVAVRQNQSFRLFIDNNEVSGSGTPTTFTTAALTIGGSAAGTFVLNGSLSHVRVYSRALSDVEVRDLYNRQSLSLGTYDVTAFNITGGAALPSYFNATNSSYAWSGSAVMSIPTYQAILTVTARQLFTNNTISSFNVSFNGVNSSTMNGTVNVPVNTGNNPYNLSVIGNYTISDSCTALSLSNTSCTVLGVYDGRYNVTAYNVVNNTVLSTFNATLENTTLGANVTATTTNGTIILQVLQGFPYNLTMSAPDYISLLYSRTPLGSANATNLSLYQALLNITARQLFTNNTISTFNVTNNQSFNNTSTSSLLIPANTGTNNLRTQVLGNYSKNETCTAVSLTTNGTCDFEDIYDNQFTINATNTTGGQLTTYTMTVTNSTLGGILYHNTTSTAIIFNLLQGYNYNFSLNKTGYNTQSVSLPANASTNNHTFNVSIITFNFMFRDEINESILNGTNITLGIIDGNGDESVYTTITGTLNVTDFFPSGEYTFRYSASGYSTRDYYATVPEADQNFTLYMISEAFYTPGIVEVRNYDGTVVSGAIIKLRRYYGDPDTPDIVQMATTQADGSAVMVAEAVTGSYTWEVIVDGVSRFNTTTPELLAIESDGLWHKTFTLGATGAEQQNQYSGFLPRFSPEGPLGNNTPYNFSFMISSDFWNVTSCTLTLTNDSNGATLGTNNSFCNSTTGPIVSLTTSQTGGITATATVTTEYFTNTYIMNYAITDIITSGFTLRDWLDDLSDFEGAGFNDFSRFLISIIIMISIVFSISRTSDVINSNEEILLLFFLLTVFFSYIDWMNLNIPNLPYESMNQWGACILIGLAAIMSYWRREEVTR